MIETPFDQQAQGYGMDHVGAQPSARVLAKLRGDCCHAGVLSSEAPDSQAQAGQEGGEAGGMNSGSSVLSLGFFWVPDAATAGS